MFLGGSFPRGNCIGDKSSERQFSSRAISRGILSGGSYLWGNFPGAIIQGTTIRGQFSLGTIVRAQFSGAQFSSGAIVRTPYRLLSWHIRFEKRKVLKKELNEELMPVAWHPNRWWHSWMSEDEKKEVDPIFIQKLQKYVSVVYNMGVLKHFAFWGIKTFLSPNLQRFWTVSCLYV